MTKVKFILGSVGVAIVALTVTSFFFGVPFTFCPEGEVLDELNGVEVYYNGEFSHVKERNTSEDGYNIGLRWQCVEFVKRYYLLVYGHKMPDAYGNAKDFFNSTYEDGALNKERGLLQFTNPSKTSPAVGDILILDGKFGHVAIVSNLHKDQLEVIQQNVGFKTREVFDLTYSKEEYKIDNQRVLGRLRMLH